MALSAGSLVEITLVQQRSSDTFLNVFQYEIDAAPGVVNAIDLATGWWNHVKIAWRAIVASNFGTYFRSVRVLELNNSAGAFGDWNIPTGESAGTRAPTAAPQALPPFNAAGIRLLVGSRLTRPGQKRIYGLTEADSDEGLLTAAYQVLLNSLGTVISAPMVLAAPVAGVTLQPIVASKDAAGTVINSQAITGFLINQYVTSQNTRKTGRGI